MISLLAVNPAVRAIGVALIWFLVQGAIAGAVVAVMLRFARRSSANLRYLIACAGLAAMTAMPVVTTARHWTSARAIVLQAPGSTSSESQVTQGPRPITRDDGWKTWVTPERLAPGVVLVWIAGVLVLTVRLLGGWLQVSRIRRSARRPTEGDWTAMVTRLARQLGVNRMVPLLESTLVGVPIVIGWLRPMILVPAGVFAGLGPEQVEAILAHELAHIRRGDYVVNALQRVVEVVLFYHPAVWWLSARIRQEREHGCDDLAAPLSSSRLTYAHALIAIEERRGRAPALAMAATRTGLFARIRRIVDPSSAVDSTLSKGTVMTIVSSVVAVALTSAMSVGHAAPVAHRRAARPAQGPAVRVPPPAVPNAARPGEATVQADASIHGIVSDQKNGRIPGVLITLDTIGRAGARRTARTDATGHFALTELSDGAYLLTATLPGFRQEERRLDLLGGADLTQNVQLKVGAIESVRTVAASTDTPAASAPASKPPQVSTATAANLLDAARQATAEGRLAEAEAAIRQALAIIHAAQPTPPTLASAPSGPVRIGGDIKEPKKIRDVPPIYPAAARAAGIQGIVIVEATVDVDGNVTDAVVVRGVPELNDAALDAVRQWGYTPTLLNGQPVSVLMSVTVIFSLK